MPEILIVCAAAQVSPVNEAALLAGRYEILSFIGSGVTSKVYKAIDRKFDVPVAVKMLNQFLATDPVSIERFKREAHITRVLMHPQIATISEILNIQGQMFLIMDYAEGVSLKEFIHLNAPLKIATAVSIIEQLLSIMSVCHQKNIIHRDIKPQNIVIDDKHRIKLLDFGIARMTSLSELTQTGTSLGTPEYMAPELFATNTYDPRTDLYAIGVIAYEMLTGVLPFQGDTIAVLYSHHLQGRISEPKTLRNEIPLWLSDLSLRLLAKQTYQRYQTSEEALQDIKSEKVILKNTPNLKEIRCFACGKSTFAEVSICVECGEDRSSLFLSGGTGLRATEDTDGKKLAVFFAQHLNISVKNLKITKRQLLVSKISRQSSAMIKMLAMKEGIYLQSTDRAASYRSNFIFFSIPPALIFCKCLYEALTLINKGYAFQGMLWCALILVFCRMGVLRNTAIISEKQIDRKDIKLQISQVTKRLFSNKNLSSDLRHMMKAVIRKYVLILNSEREKSSLYLSELGELTKTATEIAEQMGLIQIKMDAFDSKVAMEMLDDIREDIKEAKSEVEKKEKEGIYFSILESLQLFQHQEELYSRLNNRLIQINAAFNQITAQACVLRLPIDKAVTEKLQRLNTDLKEQYEPDALLTASEVS